MSRSGTQRGVKNVQKLESRETIAFMQMPTAVTLTANLLEEVVVAHIDDA